MSYPIIYYHRLSCFLYTDVFFYQRPSVAFQNDSPLYQQSDCGMNVLVPLFLVKLPIRQVSQQLFLRL